MTPGVQAQTHGHAAPLAQEHTPRTVTDTSTAPTPARVPTSESAAQSPIPAPEAVASPTPIETPASDRSKHASAKLNPKSKGEKPKGEETKMPPQSDGKNTSTVPVMPNSLPWWLGGLVLAAATAAAIRSHRPAAPPAKKKQPPVKEPLPGILAWIESLLPPKQREQFAREQKLRNAAKERKRAAKRLPGAIDKFNKENQAYRNQQEEYLKAKDEVELWQEFVDSHPLNRPPAPGHVRTRQIHREKNDDATLKPPTRENVTNDDVFTRRMTQAECEEELKKKQIAMGREFEKMQQMGKEWIAARKKLDQAIIDVQQAEKNIDLARQDLQNAARPEPPRPPFDPMDGVPTLFGSPVMVSYKPEWEMMHTPTDEERAKMIAKFNEDHPPIIVPPEHQPGDVEFDGEGYAISWWLPPIEGVEDEIRYYHQWWELTPHPDPVAPQPKPAAPLKPGKTPAAGHKPMPQPPTLTDQIRHWLKQQFGIGDPRHPLVLLLTELGDQLGREALILMLATLKTKEPIRALVAIMEHLGQKDPAGALDLRKTIVALLDHVLADPEKQKRWGVNDPKVIRDLLRENVSKLVETALQDGSQVALVTGLVFLARPGEVGGNPAGPRAAEMAKKLNEILAKQEQRRDQTDLERIHDGWLTVPQLRELALLAIKEGRLRIFSEALMTAIGRSGDPPAKKAAEVLGLIALLKKFTEDPAADKPGAAKAPALPPDAATVIENTRKEALEILTGIQKRIDTGLSRELGDALRNAMELAGTAGAAAEIARKGGDPDQMKTTGEALEEALKKVRELAQLKLMLATATLDDWHRTEELKRQLAEVQQELWAYDHKRQIFDGGDAHTFGNSDGHEKALRAMRDTAEDMIHAFDPSGIDQRLQQIFEQLNGTWHDLTISRVPFRENGVRQHLDEVRRGEKEPGETVYELAHRTYRLEDELTYLEQRRVQLLFQHPSWNAFDKYMSIKNEEVGYWKSQRPWKELAWLGETPADRVLQEVSEYRSHDLPGLLNQIGRELKDPQGFMRFLAKLRKEDIQNGMEAWESYYNTSWHERGLIVQTWRMMHVRSIIDDMGNDQDLYEALRAAGEMPVDRLKAMLPRSYQKLADAGFIHYGQYTIPEEFTYSQETVGSKMAQRHWLDDLVNVKTIGELLSTVLLPGAGAAYLAGGLQAAEGAGLFTRVGWGLLRGGTEAALFTVLNKGAKALLHPFSVSGKEFSPEALAKEYANNLAAMLGLGLLGKASQYVERVMIGEGKIAQALLKPAGELTKADLIVLLKGTALDLASTGAESSLLTGLGALPVIGNGGHFDPQTFLYNVVFMKELAWAHAVTPSGIEARNNEANGPEKQDGAPDESMAAKSPGNASAGGESVWERFQRDLGMPAKEDMRTWLLEQFKSLSVDSQNPRTREVSREMMTLLELHDVSKLSFSIDPTRPNVGAYRPQEGSIALNLEVIAREFDKYYGGPDARPTKEQLQKTKERLRNWLLGSAAHEIVHAYQGINVNPLGTRKAYTPLHEMEAYLTQRLFDKTLAGKHPEGPYQEDADAFTYIRDYVMRDYANIDPKAKDKPTPTGLTPEGLAQWQIDRQESAISKVNEGIRKEIEKAIKAEENRLRWAKKNPPRQDLAPNPVVEWNLDDPLGDEEPAEMSAIKANPGAKDSELSPNVRSPSRRRRFDWRMLLYPLAFGVVAALTAILPANLPGEMSPKQLAMREKSTCARCAPGDQILGLGLLKTSDETALNVVLGAPPVNTRLKVHLDAAGTSVEFKKRAGDAWSWGATFDPAIADPPQVLVAARGSHVVFLLPRTVKTDAVWLTTAAGDRFPAEGSIPAQTAPAPGFNVVDFLLIALLVTSACIGYRRGFIQGASGAAGLVASLVLTALFYRPLAALLPGNKETGGERTLAFGLTVVVFGVLAHLFDRFASPALVRVLSRVFRRSAGSVFERTLGVVPAWFRTIVVTAMLLAIVVDVTSFGSVNAAISASRGGSSLTSLWRSLFAGL